MSARHAPLDVSAANRQGDVRARSLMIEALRGRGGKLTRADAVAASGLSDDEASRALTALLGQFRSHVSATEAGELLYEFDPAFSRRGALTVRERLSALGTKLWRAFTVLFKVAIVTTLVAYFALFVAMMLAVVFARRGDRDDDDGFGLGALFWMWGFDPTPGYGQRRRRPGAPRIPLYKRVFAFVFGPPAAARDPLAAEKELVAYLRAARGRVAAADLVQLLGWDFARAEEEATRLLIDHGGEPEVTDDGVVLYVFKDLRKTARAADDAAPARWAWQRPEDAAPLTGNDAGSNAVIAAFNGFNLLAPLWIVPAFEARLRLSLADWRFALVDFPLAFSSVFFAIPAARWIKARIEARRRRARDVRRELLRRIFADVTAPRPREQLAPTPALAAALDRDLVSLGGDVDVDDDGRVRYVFPRLAREAAAVARARAAAPRDERDAGAVVFSSAD